MKILNIIVGVFYLIFGLFLWNHPLDTIATYSIAFGITQLSKRMVTVKKIDVVFFNFRVKK